MNNAINLQHWSLLSYDRVNAGLGICNLGIYIAQ